jgi:hypothetical protein
MNKISINKTFFYFLRISKNKQWQVNELILLHIFLHLFIFVSLFLEHILLLSNFT